jgi:hypothetical protein
MDTLPVGEEIAYGEIAKNWEVRGVYKLPADKEIAYAKMQILRR